MFNITYSIHHDTYRRVSIIHVYDMYVRYLFTSFSALVCTFAILYHTTLASQLWYVCRCLNQLFSCATDIICYARLRQPYRSLSSRRLYLVQVGMFVFRDVRPCSDGAREYACRLCFACVIQLAAFFLQGVYMLTCDICCITTRGPEVDGWIPFTIRQKIIHRTYVVFRYDFHDRHSLSYVRALPSATWLGMMTTTYEYIYVSRVFSVISLRYQLISYCTYKDFHQLLYQK